MTSEKLVTKAKVHNYSHASPVSPEGSVEATPDTANATIGDSVQFNCSALGGPGNVFTWTRVFLQTIVANTSQLVVDVDSPIDGSPYECLVRNDAGMEIANVTLNGKTASTSY